MADDQIAADESDVRPERRYLLFQLDFASKALEERLLPRWTSEQGRPAVPVAVSDYSDYDNPRSVIYWRDRLKEGWQARYEKTFKQFAADLFDLINAGKLSLRRAFSKSDPYVDFSPFVRSVSGYTVGVSDLSNALQLSIGRPDLTGAETSPGSGVQLQDTLNMFNGILPRENDVIMVLVKYPGQPYVQEYLGFVTKIDQGGSYGQIDRFDVTVDGMSKIAKVSDIIRQQAVGNNLFLPNVEINRNSTPSVFADQFNDKDVRAIYEGILDSVLAIGDQTPAKVPGQRFPYTRGYALDPRPFIPAIVTAPDGSKSVDFSNAGFQHNFFALLTIFLMTLEQASNTALFPTRQAPSPGSADYYQLVKKLRGDVGGDVAGVPDSDLNVVLSPSNRAFLDHGDNLAFNLMVANGFALFYPHMAKAEEILGEVRGTSYYDIFESRTGQMVCRPSRYNKIERTISEGARESVERSDAADGLQISRLFVSSQGKDPSGAAATSWEFNPQSDFYIRNEELADIPTRTFDDDQLDSRVDVKLNLPLAGAQDFPAASYTDPDVLLRFGLKTKGPQTNPNALNASAPIIFAPLALAMANAQARPMSIVVKDTRKYHVGKLYYLQAVDCVAYLTDESLLPTYGVVAKRQLTFSMFRRVVRRPLADITRQDLSGGYNEALNMAMCYMDDPPDSGDISAADAAQKLGFPAVKNTKELMIQKGLKMANAMRKGAVGEPTIVMFRYVPTIMDVALEVEADPNLANRDPAVQSAGNALNGTSKASNAALDGRVLAGVIDSSLALTYNFKKTENWQYYEEGFIPAFASASEGQFSASPETQVLAALNKKAPMFPAGALNYGPGADVMYGNTWFEAGTSPTNTIAWFQTPFANAALSEQPQNIRLSQLIVNKLAGADIGMKYLPPVSQASPQIYSNFGAIPQLYYFDGRAFSLFSPGVTPAEFFKDRNLAGFRIFDAISSILTGPQCLALDLDALDQFANEFDPCYRIRGNGGLFKMPFGHFMVVPGPGIPDVNQVQFVRAQSKRNSLMGGSFNVTKGVVPGQFVISPADADSTLVVEDGSGNVISAGGKYVQSAALKKLYFLSPFAEPTVERLLQFALPVEFGGQVSQATLEATKNRLKSQPAGAKVLTINNQRVLGNAVNLSPDYLAATSKSDLEVFPRRPEATAVDAGGLKGIWKRFEGGLRSGQGTLAGFKDPDAVLPVRDALKVALTYPDGSAGADRLCLVYVLQLAGAKAADGSITENRNYAASLTSARSL